MLNISSGTHLLSTLFLLLLLAPTDLLAQQKKSADNYISMEQLREKLPQKMEQRFSVIASSVPASNVPASSAKMFADARPTSKPARLQHYAEGDYIDQFNRRLAIREKQMDDTRAAIKAQYNLPTAAGKNQIVPANEQDSLVLVEFYNNTDGSSWTDNTNWLTGPVSEWTGIELDNEGRVVVIQLDQNSLFGTLPASLTSLSELQLLSLYDNFLAGSIPADLGLLQNLIIIDLGFNFFEGAIPASIGDISTLEAILLWGNSFGGSIPASLGNLANLQQLWLFLNDLSGEIPVELGDLTALTILYLDQNQLTGNIPEELGLLTGLIELFVDFNLLEGAIPEALANLTNLQILYLGDNTFGGEFPLFLTGLTNLEALYLAGAQLTGPIPGEISNLGQLTALYLNNNQLAGIIPDNLYGMLSLTRLDLSSNALAGAISEDLFGLQNLVELRLYSNLFEGPIPANISTLAILQEVDLSNNFLSGEIPEFSFNSALRRVYLANNQLSGTLANQFNAVTLLEELDVADNELSGEIPSSLGNFAILTSLFLAGNNFTGELPDAFVNLETLQILTVYGNQLTGNIPSYLGSLPDLFILDLGNNQLSGTIPANLGRVEFLALVFLDQNNLTGALPETFTNKESLFRLTIGNNELTQLPDLTTNPNLLILEVENNRLTFEDIIPNVSDQLALLSYAPQKEVYPKIDDLGATIRYEVQTGGSSNSYQWFMNGSPIAGATESVLELENTGKTAVMDTVHAEISNTQVSDLVLSSVPARTDAVLSTIRIVPDTVVVETGATLQYIALGADQFDANRLFTTTWTTTGGSIDADGIFEAGESPGTYEITATDLSGTLVATTAVIVERFDTPTAIEFETPDVDYALQGNYPNPFSTHTNIGVRLTSPARVSLRIYDVLGREVMDIIDQQLHAGEHTFTVQTSSLPAGVYFYTLETENEVATRSMIKI